jgi:sortase B
MGGKAGTRAGRNMGSDPDARMKNQYSNNAGNTGSAYNNGKGKGKGRKRGIAGIILDLLLVVFVCTALFSGYKVVSQLITDRQGEEVYDDIASLADVQETMVVTLTRPAASDSGKIDGAGIAAVIETGPAGAETAGSEAGLGEGGESEADNGAAQASGEGGEASQGEAPFDVEPEPIVIRQFDWAALRSENSDCVGWLECDDTVINYPVVQGNDNSYYLNHLFNGKQQRYGTLFIDAQNSPDFSDENTIIYGHHLKNGKMFGTLMYYGDGNNYYRKHPVFKLYTPDHVYLVELFANAYVDGAKGIPMTFATKEEYAQWIDRMYSLSTFDSDVVMTTEDRMVTLYTCSYDYETQRQLLVGKLVPLT